MQKFLVLISFSILLAISIGCDSIQAPEKIREQLAATENYIGATTIASYNENRHPTKSAVIFTIKDGEKQFHKQIDP